MDSVLQRFNFFLPQQQISCLEILSNRTGLSISELIRRALDNYIETRFSGNIVLASGASNATRVLGNTNTSGQYAQSGYMF